MKVVESFPHRVRVLEHVLIPMRDGVRLSARIWLPEGAESSPVPAILEYIPYRKRDGTAARDALNHPYFAGHGYAAVRVDIRGSGDSEGVLYDEYLQTELDDGLDIIAWLRAQPWCNGRVGMFGLSWGGFNGLQLAALQPVGLDAVVTVCSSDDRYADDVHYMGGCALTDNLSWASIMFSYNACPPDPRVVGERWREMWFQRLDDSGLWIHNWLQHQRRDAFWRHASICEDYSAIRCPVFAVSGWADGYCNTVFRLMENLDVPRKGLVGPWNHKYPHLGGPGPAIDFLRECLRWWDRWLKDIDNGVDGEPVMRAWLQDSVSPHSDDRPGRWVGEPAWPGPDIEAKTWTLAVGRLRRTTKDIPDEALIIQSPLTVGLFAGKWCSYSESTDLPTDQRLEDGGSLNFDSAILKEDVEILGAAVAELEISVDRPQAMVCARISDIAEDGKATLVTYGLLNLSHRDSHEQPEPLEPGKRYRVRVRLNDVGQRFAAGHRIRFSLSTSYWPLAWPSPEPVRMTVYTANSRLLLPERPPRALDAELHDLGEPQQAEAPLVTVTEPSRREWNVHFNLSTNEAVLDVIDFDETYRVEDLETTIGHQVREQFASANDDYASVRAEVWNRRTFEHPGWSVAAETRTVITSTPTHFRIQAALDAYEDGTRVFAKTWDEYVERDQV